MFFRTHEKNILISEDRLIHALLLARTAIFSNLHARMHVVVVEVKVLPLS
jgi:hypothetical protein